MWYSVLTVVPLSAVSVRILVSSVGSSASAIRAREAAGRTGTVPSLLTGAKF